MNQNQNRQNVFFRWVALIGILAFTLIYNGVINPAAVDAAGQPNCTYTIGYWKNHPENWPSNTVVLGSTTYVKSAGIAILSDPVGSDATHQLAAQLIAAKLNVLKGANNSAIASTITSADNFLKTNPYNSNPKGAARDTAISLAATLENWNTGKTGPGHCDDENATPTKTSASTNTPAPSATPNPTSNGQICWQGTNNASVTATTSWTVNSNGTVTIFVQFSKNFVDNTYGTNAIGWGSKGHTFSDLTGSDHVQLALYNGNNSKSMEFKVDYISSSNTVPSGYKTLGVTGGDGGMLTGSASDVTLVRTAMSENFNTYGYVLTSNSPATNFSYTPNANYPNWIFDVWYEVTVKTTPFGASGFGKPVIASVHASPSKTGNNTEPVSPVPCATPTNTPRPTATRTNTPALAPTNTPSGGTNCTYTQGFWKTHPEAWPVQTISIGGVNYSKTDAINNIFNVQPQGDATYILAQQLLAAKLNVLKGADNSAVASTMTNADAFLQAHPLGSNPQGTDRDSAIAMAATLDDYNNGRIGPGHCGDEVITPTPTRTNTPVSAPSVTPTFTSTPCNGGIFGFVRADGNGISSVQVVLKSGANVLSTTQTNSSGAFLFQPVANGSYTVQITVPSGYVAQSPTAPTVNISECSFVQVDFDLARFTPTPTRTNTAAPAPTATPTNTPSLNNCTFTQGYWKTHPEAWPVQSISIGGVNYSKTDAINNIFNVQPQGDATYILAQQLLAAKLNVLKGADSSAVASTITNADAFLQAHPLGSNPQGTDRDSAIAMAATLDDYNNGRIGPGHCGDEVITPTPTRTNTPVPPTNTPTDTPTRTNTPAPAPSLTPTNTPTRTNTPAAAPTVTPTTDICGNLTGAIFTTDPQGNLVNGNIYASKLDVFLQGGPDQQGAHVPDGTYFYRVTDPNTGTILYLDGFRTVVVANNVFPATQLAPFNDSPNNGNEYKVSLSKVSTFDNNCTKTDNFKVIVPAPTATQVPPTATRTNTPAPAPSLTPTNTRTPAPNVCVGIIFGVVREGGNGVDNVTVTLKDAALNPLQTMLTSGGGIYAFSGLPPATYFVQITVPNGYVAVGPTLQNGTIVQSGQICNNIQADFDLARFTPTPTNTSVPPTNTPTRTNTPAPAPSLTPTNTPTRTNTPAPAPSLTPTNTPLPTATPIQLGSLCALVYHDLNGNAIRNSGEPLLSNAVVTVKNSANVFIGSFTTNGTEPRCFTNLPPDVYIVTEQDPGGFFSTTSNLVAATVFSNVTTTVEFGDKQQIALAPTPTPTRTPAPAPPITIPGISEPKGMASLNNRLYIASRNTNSVFVWDEIGATILKQIAVGTKPWGVAAVNNKIYVANNVSSSVSVISPTTLTKTKDLKFNGICDGGPANVAGDTTNNRVFVAIYGNRVAVIDANSDTLVDCIPTDGGTFGVAYNPSLNQLYVSNRDGMSLQVFDVSTNPATLLQDEKLGGVPFFVEANLGTNEVYVMVAFNPPDYDQANNLEVFSAFPGGMALSLATIVGNTDDGGFIRVSQANAAIYVNATADNQLQVVDPVTFSVCATVNLTDPFGMTENPGLGRMYIGMRLANQLDIESDALCGGPPGGP